MKKSRILIPGTALLLLTIVFVVSSADRTRPFARHILSPVRASVRDVRYEGNGFLGLMLEPVVWIRFAAAPEDVSQIVQQREFKVAVSEDRDWFRTRSGPAWWWSQPLGDGSRLYKRQGRRGSEYLRVDQTGTNVFYLLWGI